MAVTIGVLRETAAGETRVALVPEVISKYSDMGARIMIENGAGLAAQIPDQLYTDVDFSPHPQ